MSCCQEHGPSGRCYRRSDGSDWTVELEIGGRLWMKSAAEQVITVNAADLDSGEWERVV